MAKTRINLSLDEDLAGFVKAFANENRTSVADVFTQYLLALKRNAEGEKPRTFMSHPAFERAMKQAISRLRSGKARWYSYDEVFGD